MPSLPSATSLPELDSVKSAELTPPNAGGILATMSFWETTTFASGVAALIGGCIAGLFALLAVDRTYQKNLSLQKKNQEKLINAFLQAVHDEIETLWDAYHKNAGVELENLPEGEPFKLYWPILQDYFTIYNNNASLIGHVEDHDLRKLIVQVYAKARGLIDSYRLNNEMFAKYEQSVLLFNQTLNPAFKQQANGVDNALRDYAKKMKKSHTELKDLTNQLLRRLK